MLSYEHESNYNPTQAFPVAVLPLARVGYIINILLPAASGLYLNLVCLSHPRPTGLHSFIDCSGPAY